MRFKLRLFESSSSRSAFGIQVARSSARRERLDVQNERLSAIDVVFPLEFFPLLRGSFIDQRLAVYAAPRLVLQRFEDRPGLRSAVTKGNLVGALFGLTGRWRYLAAIGEMNFVRTPTMQFSGTTFGGGWHLLPMASLRGMLPNRRVNASPVAMAQPLAQPSSHGYTGTSTLHGVPS